jgi:hypothetical protein
MKKEGQRVGAILGTNDTSVDFLGYGVYEGDYIPKEAVGFLAGVLKRAGRENPRIRLDNGGIVYGCECWWGDEEKVRTNIQTYKENGLEIKMVDINKVRGEFKDKEEKDDETSGGKEKKKKS